jgi:hypothetical protein
VNKGLKGSVSAAPSGCRGFDTDTQLTAATAKAFRAAGFQFVIRYLSLEATEQAGDLSTEEAQAILGAGLGLMAVQRVSEPGWRPTAHSGEEYGANAASNAHRVGLPAGMNLWLDLEGMNSGSPAGEVSAYCNAWFEQAAAAGYVPGLYVGAGAILNSEQLDALNVNYFWKSGSSAGSRQPGSCFEYAYPEKGYCMVQSISASAQIDGVCYDSDAIKQDNCGDTPLWLARTGKGADTTHSGAEPEVPKGATPPSKSRSVAAVVGIAAAAIILYSAGILSGPYILQKLGYPSLPAPSASMTHEAGR